MRQAYPVAELRQYTMVEGTRDPFIELFEREFIETQEQVGMKLVGQFLDIDNPDRFVWIRAFPSMEARLRSLETFYYGPVWQKHRDAANPSLKDNDNVLLLRAASDHGAFPVAPPRAAPGTIAPAGGVIVATIYYLKGGAPDFHAFFEDSMAPVLKRFGVEPLAYFVRETATNSFPRLPVREEDEFLIWFGRFENRANHHELRTRIESSASWRTEVSPKLSTSLKREPEILRLQPTARSELR